MIKDTISTNRQPNNVSPFLVKSQSILNANTVRIIAMDAVIPIATIKVSNEYIVVVVHGLKLHVFAIVNITINGKLA